MAKLTGFMTVIYPDRSSREVLYTAGNVSDAISAGATWYLSGRDYDSPGSSPFPLASGLSHLKALRGK